MKYYPESFLKLTERLEKIPTIGRKSAFRLAYYLALESKHDALSIAHSIEECVSSVRLCEKCGGVCESRICEICEDEGRQNGQLCILSHPRDIFLIEEMGEFMGRYFVLNSIQSCNLELLRERISSEGIREVIFAFTPSLASDSTMLFIEEKLKDFNLHFSKIAQGVPLGVQLENIDQLSLLRAFLARTKI